MIPDDETRCKTVLTNSGLRYKLPSATRGLDKRFP